MKETKKKTFNKVQMILGGLLVIALLGLGVVTYGYLDAINKIDLLTQAQNEMSQEEIDTLLAEVSAHMLLPADETPAIATIFDAAALSETQMFFKQAIDGDKVIIYSDKAIIFRPKEGLIINVGPVIQDTPAVELGEDGQPLVSEEVVPEEEVVEEYVPEEVAEETVQAEEAVVEYVPEEVVEEATDELVE